MHLQRIEANTLPTNENLKRKIHNHNPLCALCHQEAESIVHVFLKCPTTKALWYSCCWGFKPNDRHFFTSEDIIKLFIDLPKAPFPSKDQWLITLNIVVILDKIWQVRNHILHHGGIVNIHAFYQTHTSKPCRFLLNKHHQGRTLMQQCCSPLQMASKHPPPPPTARLDKA